MASASLSPQLTSFWRRNGWLIDVDAVDAYEVIDGSMERHEFRFAQILGWIKEQVRPLSA